MPNTKREKFLLDWMKDAVDVRNKADMKALKILDEILAERAEALEAKQKADERLNDAQKRIEDLKILCKDYKEQHDRAEEQLNYHNIAAW